MPGYRTLIRIIDVSDTSITMIIPGWNPRQPVQRSREAFGAPGSLQLYPGAHIFAQVNIDAESEEQLHFTDFEDIASTDPDGPDAINALDDGLI